jgi:16S rRNA (guanine(966)-N(2))-methyltransferase RsmD
VEGASVLDLFAGTGSLGIEALSRGADRATFVERARPAAALLRRNLGELGLSGRARVLARDVRAGLSGLKREGVQFDLIFADPPYARPNARDWTGWLVREAGLDQLLADEGALLVERARETRTPDPVGPIELQGSKSYGGTSFDRYQRKGKAGE